MSFPEWGNSYNALYVPLTNDWQCSLVPVRDVQDVDRGWTLSYEERQEARREREKQIEQDRRDFARLFRVSIGRRDARTCRDFAAYAAFIGEHLRISGWDTPVDGESVTRILRDAVRDGWLVPAIDRAWRGGRQVIRFYAPQSWPKRAPEPKPSVYGFLGGQLVPFGPDGRLVDNSPYVPLKSSGGADWLGTIQAAAQAVVGNDSSLDNDTVSDNSTLLGDAQPFDYSPVQVGGNSFDVAKTPNLGEPGSWYTNPGSGQMRLYGNDGKPVLDLDFDHVHNGLQPHAHNWTNGVRDGGSAVVPFSPWNP